MTEKEKETSNMNSLSAAYEECRVLNRHYGTRFYHALHLFPKELQPHIHGLCAFDRILLEIIQNPKEGIKKQDQIDAMLAWQKAFEENVNDSSSSNIYLRALTHTSKIFDLDSSDFKKITDTRMKDIEKSQYLTYRQLKSYIDSTAGLIAKQMSLILGIKDKKQQKALMDLARAGELIELVSDFGNAINQGKCYFPLSDLKRFSYSSRSMKAKKLTKGCKRLLEHYLSKAEKELEKAKKHLADDQMKYQFAFTSLIETYEQLISTIRAKGYDVFTKQPKLGWKLKIKHSIFSLGNLVR